MQLADLGEQLGYLLRLRQVGAQHVVVAAGLLQLLFQAGDVLAGVLVAGDDVDTGTGQREHDTPADTAGAAGDQGLLAPQFEIHGETLLRCGK